MASFDKTTVYHSALVGAGELRIKILSGAKPSKFPKEGTPNVFVEFEHEGRKHQYTAETQQCADVLGSHQGEEITIRATGSRAEARIEVLGVDGRAQQPRSGTAPGNGAGNGHGAAVDPHAAYSNARKLVAQELVMYEICFQAAWSFVKRTPLLADGDKEQVAQRTKDIASSLFIRTERENFGLHSLPMKAPDASATKPQRQPEPEPEPVRHPEPDPMDDTASEDDLPF